MTTQTKTLLAGAAGVAATRFYFKQPWLMSALAGAAVMTAFLLLTDTTNTPTT